MDATPGSHILVVDDEPRNRALLRAVLGDQHEVTEVASGSEAIDVVSRDASIDLVLLDVMMPGLDGFATCRRIKALRAEPFLPVLLLTALADQQSRNDGFEAGADDFISKPFDRRELLLRTRAFLRLRHQDERIRDQLDDLRQLDQLKEDLAALLVHDMRNPLAGLSGLLEVLQQDEGRSADDREVLREALAASRHLRDAVEDILRVRSLEEHRLVPHRERVHLRAVVAAAAASLEGDARARGLRIELAPGDDVEVAVDPALVRRAIENVLANALRYTRPRTAITLETHVTDDQVEVTVADRGPGVPDAFKQTVFEKYGSVESSKTRSRRGSGLGLYMVKLACELHDGQASVEDREGGGAVFHLRLPRQAAA